MPTLLAITAIGADRPGIVADVTGVLVAEGCNLEDTSMSILRGHFAMVLIVAAPDGVDAATLEAAIGGAAPDLVISVGAVRQHPADADADAADRAVDAALWTVVVYGADHPGIVHGIATALAERRVNIVDLTTRVSGGADRPIYSMVIEVELPPDVDGDELRRALDERAAELGVECSAHPSEADIL